MASQYDPFEGISVFDDKGEVKSLVDRIIQETDPEVVIDRMRKVDFSYVFTLSKRNRSTEVELSRSEIEASWAWRRGQVDEGLQKKIEKAIAAL
ncbi:MAG: hypothetical protein N3G78_09505 [Desulfobacterota bacterium]|nr:hypothetical protein [Thermodesulfobacteriota bacterium]